MAQISIIVPTYNVSSYIEQCIFSLTQQTFKDIEILVVDDCGTDDSIDKVTKIAKTDKRIKIIHNKTNQGVAETRNIGLKHVSAPYTSFLDPDDWVAPDFYEKLYSDITKYDADIAVSDVLYYYKEDSSLSRAWVSQWNFKTKKKVVSSPTEKQFNIYGCACWGKLYKTTLFTQYDVKCPKGLKIEDVPITAITTILAKRIVLVKEAVLYYRQHKDSIMASSKKDKTPFDIFKIYEYTDTLIRDIEKKSNKDFGSYHQIMDNFKIFNIYAWYNRTAPDYQSEFFNNMREIFKKINIKQNPYITLESKKIYEIVISSNKRITYRLFGFVLPITCVRTVKYSKIYLFKHILIDKIKFKNQKNYHKLFGFLPIISVKQK